MEVATITRTTKKDGGIGNDAKQRSYVHEIGHLGLMLWNVDVPNSGLSYSWVCVEHAGDVFSGPPMFAVFKIRRMRQYERDAT